MGAFQNYPYADVHQLNLDWIIKEVKEVKNREDEIDEAVSNSKGYAENAQESAENASESATSADNALNAVRADIESWNTRSSSLREQVDTNSGNIATQTARIDAIISGVTPDANAELIDIRVEYDGTTAPTAGDAVRDQVTNIHSDINDLVLKVFETGNIAYSLNDIPGITKRAGSNGTVAPAGQLVLQNNANFDSYYFMTDQSLDIYCTPSGSYMSICILENASGNWVVNANDITMNGSSAVRYRTIDNNLPSSVNPVTVMAGSLVSFTVSAGHTSEKAVLSGQVTNKLNNNVELNTNQLQQTKTCKLKYNTGLGPESSSEWLDIYIPKDYGFIHYTLVHIEDNAINSDVWRIAKARTTDDNLVDITDLTTAGEWEMAIKLLGRSDFIGGYQHGDEKLITDALFFIDGIEDDITLYTSITNFNSLSVVQTANMFDPEDHVSIVGRHGSEHLFNSEDMTIKQSVKWSASYSLGTSFMAMLPIAKTVSTQFLTDVDYMKTPLINNSYAVLSATSTKIYSANVSCDFSIPKYTPVADYLLITDNGGNPYNKCYYTIESGRSVSQGELWRTETRYNWNFD